MKLIKNGDKFIRNSSGKVLGLNSVVGKQWTYISDGQGPSSGALLTLVENDDWIKTNWNNDDLVIIIKPNFIPQPGNDLRSCVHAFGSNKPFRVFNNTLYYGCAEYYWTNSGDISWRARNYPLKNPNDRGDIGAYSNGSIKLVTYQGPTYALQAGEWIITAFLD